MSGSTTYPLAWPAGWPRTPPGFRKHGKFGKRQPITNGFAELRDITVAQALTRLQDELDRIGAQHCVLSSNLETKLDGQPRSGQSEPGDTGVCLYFQLKNRPTTMPCDRYWRVADNIAALAAHIEATRAIERHGVGTLDQMFTGFQAIRGTGPRPWREVLGFKPDQPASRQDVNAAWERLIREHHPDAGGTDQRAAEINAARDEALKGEVAGWCR